MNNQCPWCDGRDRNFRPLRFGTAVCANDWHNETAICDEPCRKHGKLNPCPYCKIEELEAEIKELQTNKELI